MKWAAARGEKFDHCVLGEPSNVAELGDTIKLGRRGSQNGMLVVTGKQGHVAYPHRADNPVRGLVKLMSALMDEPLDDGSAKFDPSNLEFTSIDIGNPTVNLIPGEARARFNIRFNDCHTYASLKALVEQRAGKAAAGKVRWRIDWEPSNADVFYTEPSPFTDVVIGAVAEVTGRKPKLSTSGGTSDARFIKDYCPVVEFGLVGTTMHAIDERVPVADLADADGGVPADPRQVFRLRAARHFGRASNKHPQSAIAATTTRSSSAGSNFRSASQPLTFVRWSQSSTNSTGTRAPVAGSSRCSLRTVAKAIAAGSSEL